MLTYVELAQILLQFATEHHAFLNLKFAAVRYNAIRASLKRAFENRKKK